MKRWRLRATAVSPGNASNGWRGTHIMLDFDNEPIARDDAYRAVSAVVASQLAFAGIKALALPATAARADA